MIEWHVPDDKTNNCRKRSFLSLKSFSPSLSRRSSPVPGQAIPLGKTQSASPQHSGKRKKGLRTFFKKPSFFNKIEVNENKAEAAIDEPSYLGQIYKNVKFKFSRTFPSKSSSSSQVTFKSHIPYNILSYMCAPFLQDQNQLLN